MLTELPSVVVDVLLERYIADNDLRVIHQVSKGWRDMIEQRPLVNNRRLALVNIIRAHKENIRQSTQPLELPPAIGEPKSTDPSKSKERDDGKPGSGKALRSGNSNNQIRHTPTQTHRSTAHKKGTRSGSSAGAVTRISSTPKSRFQRRYEAGLKLMAGQVLFSCPDCRSPVPSPVTQVNQKPKVTHNESSESDSGIHYATSPSESREGERSVEEVRRRDLSSENFEFKSPDFDCISISMIATPPFTPPVFLATINQNKNESLHDLQQTKSPSYPLISSASTCSNISEIADAQSTANSIYSIMHGTESSIFDLTKEIRKSLSASLQDRDSGVSSPREKTKTSPNFLVRSHTKQLKVKSSSSPSLLVTGIPSEPERLTPENLPYVVECPYCSYRFCSRCEFREHPGKPCRVIGEIGLEDEEEDCACLRLPSSRPASRSRSTTSGGKAKSNKKGSLRRLARL